MKIYNICYKNLIKILRIKFIMEHNYHNNNKINNIISKKMMQ